MEKIISHYQVTLTTNALKNDTFEFDAEESNAINIAYQIAIEKGYSPLAILEIQNQC